VPFPLQDRLLFSCRPFPRPLTFPLRFLSGSADIVTIPWKVFQDTLTWPLLSQESLTFYLSTRRPLPLRLAKFSKNGFFLGKKYEDFDRPSLPPSR